MKFILSILLLSGLMAQPIHHRIKNALVNGGYIDQWSLFHVEAGLVKTFGNEVFWWMNERYNWMNEPSDFTQVKWDFYSAMLWEVGEYVFEADGSWSKYQDMYGGKAIQNNLTDVILDVTAFMTPKYKGMYYDFKIWRKSFNLTVYFKL